MYSSKPVIAVNLGGPLETVIHGETGFLCDPTPPAFAKAMSTLVKEPQKAEQMGKTGRSWVRKTFSLDAFSTTLDEIVRGELSSGGTESKKSGKKKRRINIKRHITWRGVSVHFKKKQIITYIM